MREDPYRRPSRTSDARWLPTSDEPTEKFQGHRRPPRRHLLTSGKFALTIVSVLILVVTGYYYGELKPWQDGLTTADVIDAGADREAGRRRDRHPDGRHGQPHRRAGQPALARPSSRSSTRATADGELNTDTLIMIRIPNDGREATGVSHAA